MTNRRRHLNKKEQPQTPRVQAEAPRAQQVPHARPAQAIPAPELALDRPAAGMDGNQIARSQGQVMPSQPSYAEVASNSNKSRASDRPTTAPPSDSAVKANDESAPTSIPTSVRDVRKLFKKMEINRVFECMRDSVYISEKSTKRVFLPNIRNFGFNGAVYCQDASVFMPDKDEHKKNPNIHVHAQYQQLSIVASQGHNVLADVYGGAKCVGYAGIFKDIWSTVFNPGNGGNINLIAVLISGVIFFNYTAQIKRFDTSESVAAEAKEQDDDTTSDPWLRVFKRRFKTEKVVLGEIRERKEKVEVKTKYTVCIHKVGLFGKAGDKASVKITRADENGKQRTIAEVDKDENNSITKGDILYIAFNAPIMITYNVTHVITATISGSSTMTASDETNVDVDGIGFEIKSSREDTIISELLFKKKTAKNYRLVPSKMESVTGDGKKSYLEIITIAETDFYIRDQPAELKLIKLVENLPRLKEDRFANMQNCCSHYLKMVLQGSHFIKFKVLGEEGKGEEDLFTKRELRENAMKMPRLSHAKQKAAVDDNIDQRQKFLLSVFNKVIETLKNDGEFCEIKFVKAKKQGETRKKQDHEARGNFTVSLPEKADISCLMEKFRKHFNIDTSCFNPL